MPSTAASSSNVTVKLFEVSSAANVTSAGTPEYSSAARFAPRAALIGSTTSRSGAWLRPTVTGTEVPSGAEAAARPNDADTIGTSLSATVSASVSCVPGT